MSGLYAKLTRGEPMTRVDRLDLDPADGIAGDANAIRRSPRQVCIAIEESLDEHGVKADGARSNIVLAGASDLASGALLDLGTARIRVTFACEPCAHGATGGPVHRVLTAGMAAPSWAPDALEDLAEERGKAGGPEPYPLVDALWFST